MFDNRISKSFLGMLVLTAFLFGSLSMVSTDRVFAKPKVILDINSQNLPMINVNTASKSELVKITGIGPAIAARIIDYRKANGDFENPEDLAKIRGIGGVKLQKIKNQVTV